MLDLLIGLKENNKKSQVILFLTRIAKTTVAVEEWNCRYCLERITKENFDDVCAPCNCIGSIQFVHSVCLKV